MFEVIWILNIEHRHGNDVSLHSTKEKAYAHLHDYVQHWWSDELGDEEMPANPKEAIQRYFQVTGEMGREYYNLDEGMVDYHSPNSYPNDEYRVSWGIDVWANSPEEAAQKAREAQIDSETIAKFFTVTHKKTWTTKDVDLQAVN